MKKLDLFFLLILFVVGCSSGTNFDSKLFDKIIVYQTTQEEVRQWFGNPYSKMNDGSKITWIYSYAQSTGFSAKAKSLLISFIKDTVVSKNISSYNN